VFHKVTTDSPASVTVSSIDGEELGVFSVEEGKKQFFGLTTGGEGYIGSVMVTLGEGVHVSKVWHNTPVPEPTTLLLLGSGLLGLAGLGRKKFLKRNGKRSFDPSTELPPSFDNFRLRLPVSDGPASADRMAGQAGFSTCFRLRPPASAGQAG
jgi:hypothetical protein